MKQSIQRTMSRDPSPRRYASHVLPCQVVSGTAALDLTSFCERASRHPLRPFCMSRTLVLANVWFNSAREFPAPPHDNDAHHDKVRRVDAPCKCRCGCGQSRVCGLDVCGDVYACHTSSCVTHPRVVSSFRCPVSDSEPVAVRSHEMMLTRVLALDSPSLECRVPLDADTPAAIMRWPSPPVARMSRPSWRGSFHCQHVVFCVCWIKGKATRQCPSSLVIDNCRTNGSKVSACSGVVPRIVQFISASTHLMNNCCLRTPCKSSTCAVAQTMLQ